MVNGLSILYPLACWQKPLTAIILNFEAGDIGMLSMPDIAWREVPSPAKFSLNFKTKEVNEIVHATVQATLPTISRLSEKERIESCSGKSGSQL